MVEKVGKVEMVEEVLMEEEEEQMAEEQQEQVGSRKSRTSGQPNLLECPEKWRVDLSQAPTRSYCRFGNPLIRHGIYARPHVVGICNLSQRPRERYYDPATVGIPAEQEWYPL